jgi:nucleotide-binding universal stress UspA family protein
MKILLAIDRSPFSEAATECVIRQVRPEGTEVCVLHAMVPTAMIPEWNVGGAGQEHKEANRLVAGAEQLLRNAGFKVRTLVEEADPRAAIVDQAAKWKADLIVVGSHGYRGLDRLMIGSVSEFVARHAPCSVQIVKMPRTEGA